MDRSLGRTGAWRWGGLSFLVLSSVLGGCVREPRVFEAVHRLVDDSLRSGIESNVPPRVPPFRLKPLRSEKKPSFEVASLENDTRLVIAAPPYDFIAIITDEAIPADGVVELNRALPRALQGAAEILVTPAIRLGTDTFDLAPLVVPVVREGELERIKFRLEAPEVARGQTVNLSLYGYSLTWPNRVRQLAPAVEIPPEARIEVSVGLSNPGAAASTTTFRLNACDVQSCVALTEVELQATPGRPDVPWKSVRADLSPFAGRKVRFEFIAETPGSAETARVFPLWANPTVFAPRSREAPGVATNVVLISLDTLAAGHMSVYGYSRETTPKMEKSFARNGVVFDRCMSMATATAPSHMTMMTGLYPLEHNVTDGSIVVDPDLPLISDLIRARGMETAAFTEDGWLSVQLGFGSGFNSFHEDRSPDVSAPVGRVESTFGRAREWLGENRDKPFFLFLHTFEVHDPYSPPAEYQSMFVGETMEQDVGIAEPIVRDRLAYDREIRYVDDQLDLLLEKIHDEGLEKSTLVIVVSDHGEAFGQHGWVLHNNYAYEEVLHVPLMMRGAGVKGGRRLKDLVGHVDLAPTILSMMGVRLPAYALRGASLGASLAGDASGTSFPARAMFSESWGSIAMDMTHEYFPFAPPAFAVRRDDLKLVRYRTETGFRYEGFDLAQDPWEKRESSELRSGDFAELRALLDGYETEAKRGKHERAQTGMSTETDLAPDQEEKLRALGYLQ